MYLFSHKYNQNDYDIIAALHYRLRTTVIEKLTSRTNTYRTRHLFWIKPSRLLGWS